MQVSLRFLLFVYVFGGLTFIPLVLAAIIAFVYYTSPLAPPPEAKKPRTEKETSPESSEQAAGEDLRDEDELEGVDAHKVGWLQVSREYDSSIGLIGPEKIPGNQRGKYMDKMRSLLDRQDRQEATLSQSSSNFLKSKAAMFYAILKHGNLFLYTSEDQLDVKHVIVLQHYLTSLWPPYEDDDILFLKPNAICLSRKDPENPGAKPKTNIESSDPKANARQISHRAKPPENAYFLFPTTNSEKEDWYFALLRGSKPSATSTKSVDPKDPIFEAVPARFDSADMISLIHSIHSSDAQLQTRWLNALIGRIFLGIYQTKHLEEICIMKITKKIARINRPAFLSDIKVQKVMVGTQAPVFTQPRLKELSASGELTGDINVTYNGGFRVEIATVATLQLGSRFKPRQVSLSLAVTIKRLEGKMMLKVKKPPSNRIWVGFYEPPSMDLTIEPIVSSRQIKYTMVLRAIESRIREAIEESIVLPNMDDVAFLPTTGSFYRGGIWQRNEDERLEHPDDPAALGDVDAVEKQMEEMADKLVQAAEDTKAEENNEATDLQPKRGLRTTLRSPTRETASPSPHSELNLKGRTGRSSSFTSVASAPAVVATDPINVPGTSPSRDNTDWAAEAAARALAQKARAQESPKINSEPTSERNSRPLSLKSESSSPDLMNDDLPKDVEFPPLSLQDRSMSAPPSSPPNESEVPKSTDPAKRTSTLSFDKDGALSQRVSQATGAAREMFKTRLNTYLAKRQQSKLEKQILAKDRDLLVNAPKPRTRLPSDSMPNLVVKSEDEDVDSGPLPFEDRKSPGFPSAEYSAQSPGYGPSAMMMIPSTMANARPSTEIEAAATPTPPPALPPRSPSVKRPVPPPPLPPRSAPRPIPRRPVPHPPSHLSESTEAVQLSSSSSPEQSKDEEEKPNGKTNFDEEEDLLILHIPSDDGEDLASGSSSIKDVPAISPSESPKPRTKVAPEEEAVLEPSSYGSNKSRRASLANETAQQWNEKQMSDRPIPEIMEEGLMG